MTDYRLRNRDLLYPARAEPALNWRTVVVFSVIAAAVTLGVVGHLAERFNAATPGLAAAPEPAPEHAMQLATPGGSRSGS